jgi:hypothetical protein
MTPALLNSLVIQPVVAELNWPQPRERAVLLLAIATQESGLRHRVQQPTGPARSWWQLELSTAIDCCTRNYEVRNLCAEIGREYEHSDSAACVIAAGILRITRGKLPKVGDVEKAWNYYLKAWRPGKPAQERWQQAYEQAARFDAGHLLYRDVRYPRVALSEQAIPAADIGWVSNT